MNFLLGNKACSIPLFIYPIVYWVSFVCLIIIGALHSGYDVPKSILSGASVFSFLVVIAFAFLSLKFWIALFPVVVLFIPNAVNDFFPSFPMGPPSEMVSAKYSIVSHVDLYFFVFFVHFFRNFKSVKFKSYPCNLLHLTFWGYLIYIGSAIRYFEEPDTFGLFLAGSYQFRYFFYGIFFFVIFEEKLHLKIFIRGVLLGLLLLCIEAVIFSILNGNSRLSSGNFGVNVFANLLVFLIFYLGLSYRFLNGYERFSFYIISLLGLTTIFLTGTRIALISLAFGAYFFSLLYCMNRGSIGVRSFSSLFLVVFPLMSLIFFATIYFYEIYNLLGHEAMSSLVTRALLWYSSFEILSENLLGVGNLLFNIYRYDYYDVAILLDPHSDYIGFLVSYGVFGGMIISLAMLFCLFSSIRNSKQYFRFGYYPFVVFFSLSVLFVSSITNSNFQKHQVFILAVIVFFSALKSKSVKTSERQI